MNSDPYIVSASWASAPSKTLMNAFARVGLPVPAMPAPRRASIEIQWVDAMGKCSNVYALGAYSDIVRLASAIDGVGKLHYVIHIAGTIGYIPTPPTHWMSTIGYIPTQLIQ